LLRRAIIFAAMLLVAGPAMSQTLWGPTKHGMTVDQVRAVVPDATAPTTPDSLHSGSVELLRVPSLEIANTEFRVSMFFDHARRLTDVHVSPAQKLSAHSPELARDSLLTVLRSKYGPELSNNAKRGNVMTMRRADWSVAGTSITLLQVSIGNTGSLTVSYSVRIGADAKKL
jgi:hypothetical protein